MEELFLFSVGIDMVEIERIKKSMKNKNFLKRILGDDEYEQLKENGLKAQSIAANFCAKEAFSKAIGTGFRGFSLKDIQVMRDELGCPFLKFQGYVNDLVKKEKYSFSVSMTHTAQYASAVVICMKGDFLNGSKRV